MSMVGQGLRVDAMGAGATPSARVLEEIAEEWLRRNLTGGLTGEPCPTCHIVPSEGTRLCGCDDDTPVPDDVREGAAIAALLRRIHGA